jgi:hypothetical protein
MNIDAPAFQHRIPTIESSEFRLSLNQMSFGSLFYNTNLRHTLNKLHVFSYVSVYVLTNKEQETISTDYLYIQYILLLTSRQAE